MNGLVIIYNVLTTMKKSVHKQSLAVVNLQCCSWGVGNCSYVRCWGASIVL